MRWDQTVQYASRTDIGLRRRNNQDALVVQICSDREQWEARGHLFVVADGMGGHAVGELASKIAVDTIPHTYYKNRQDAVDEALRDSIETANRTIYERGSLNREFERMGTTCSALTLSPRGAIIGHVGDSRVYRVRDGRIDQLTFDHSLQWELMRQGQMRHEDIMLHPRNVITRSLGPEEQVEVDVEGPLPVLPGDTYVLCSDGLTGFVDNDEIGAIAASLAPTDACRLLVNLANARGGSDNISVIVVHVGPPGSRDSEIAVPRPTELDSDFEFSWMVLLGLWGLAALMVVGICLILFQYRIAGILITGVATLLLTMLFMRWYRELSQRDLRPVDRSVHARPYRSAKARLTRRMLSKLQDLENSLQRTALEERWTVDWDAHRRAEQEVETALKERKYLNAFRGYATMLDVFMAVVHHQRRQRDQENKWGVT